MINFKVKVEEKAEEVVQPQVVNATSSTTSELTIIGIASLRMFTSPILQLKKKKSRRRDKTSIGLRNLQAVTRVPGGSMDHQKNLTAENVVNNLIP